MKLKKLTEKWWGIIILFIASILTLYLLSYLSSYVITSDQQLEPPEINEETNFITLFLIIGGSSIFLIGTILWILIRSIRERNERWITLIILSVICPFIFGIYGTILSGIILITWWIKNIIRWVKKKK
jgi:hypothetical protein